MHRAGDWHRSIHLWVILRGAGGPRVVLQRRSRAKDTHPGLVDVSVAGHLRAGEGDAEALREADEEIGLTVALSDTVVLGRRRVEKVVPAGVDREVQSVLATVTDRAFGGLRPDLDEVAALYAPTLADALAYARGERTLLEAPALDVMGNLSLVELRGEDFIPDEDGYHRRCLTALSAHLRGETFTPFELR